MKPFAAAILVPVLMIACAIQCAAAPPQPAAFVVELENPLASKAPLQGYLRQADRAEASAAVVLLHGCSGNWRRIDQRLGRRIASLGYGTLTRGRFGPRGLDNTRTTGAPVDPAFGAYPPPQFL